jgi:hypothetical protein
MIRESPGPRTGIPVTNLLVAATCQGDNTWGRLRSPVAPSFSRCPPSVRVLFHLGMDICSSQMTGAVVDQAKGARHARAQTPHPTRGRDPAAGRSHCRLSGRIAVRRRQCETFERDGDRPSGRGHRVHTRDSRWTIGHRGDQPRRHGTDQAHRHASGGTDGRLVVRRKQDPVHAW